MFGFYLKSVLWPLELICAQLNSLELVWTHSIPLEIDWTDLFAFLTWYQLVQLGLTWFHLMSLGCISFVLISIGSYLTRCMWIQSKSRGTHLHSPEFTSTHMPSMIHTSPQGKGKATHCQREKDKSETSTFDSFPPSIPPRARTLDTQNETMSRVGPLLLIYLIHFLLLMSPTDLAPRPFPGQSFGLHLFHVGI